MKGLRISGGGCSISLGLECKVSGFICLCLGFRIGVKGEGCFGVVLQPMKVPDPQRNPRNPNRALREPAWKSPEAFHKHLNPKP